MQSVFANKQLRLFLVMAGAFLILTGCAPKTRNIDMDNDQAGAVMGLDYRDFENAARDMVQSIIRSGSVDSVQGKKFVLAISRIVNDTMQHIDTDQLIKKIRIELLRSGRVYVTTAVSAGGPEDSMNYQARELRENEEFKKDSVAGKGELLAPDLSLSGKILQRNIRMNKKEQQVEYYFQLTLTNVKTGLAIWEDETLIGKRGSNKAVSW